MDLFSLILTSIVGYFVVRYFVFGKRSRFDELGLLYKRPVPYFGNVTKAIFKRQSFAETVTEIYKHNEEAKYVGFYDFTGPKIMIRSPEFIKNISIKNFDHFIDHQSIVDPDLDALFANNLFALCGDRWKDMRHLLSPAFTSSKMKGMFKLMKKCGKDFGDYLAAQSNHGPHVEDFKNAFTKYTNDVIATCAFGISVDSMKNPNNEFYVTAKKAISFQTSFATRFLIIRQFPSIAKLLGLCVIDAPVVKFFENIVKETIETRDREGITRPDMIQLMMESRGTNAIDKRELTPLEMTAQAFIFFLGGFDSSSTIMAFAAYETAINQQVQEKLHAEIEAVLEATNGDPTYEAINGMEYLDAVISETLRLYPSFAYLDRVCKKPYELPPAVPGAKAVTLQPGESVIFPVFSIHRDSQYFSEPNSFRPERFIGSRKNEIDPSTYFPFGQGPRMCIGNRFALLQTKVVLFYLLAKCNLKPCEQTLVPIELSKTNFVTTAKNGFWLQVESRSNDISRNNTDSNGTSIKANGKQLH